MSEFVTHHCEQKLDAVNMHTTEEGITLVSPKAETSTGDSDTDKSATALQEHSRQQNNSVTSFLVPVPENELLLHVEPQNLDSYENVAVNKTMESTSGRESRLAFELEYDCSKTWKRKPLTATKQVSLWLARVSTQDIHQQLSKSSLPSFANPDGKSLYKKSSKSSNSKVTHFINKNKFLSKRNLSTRSLMDKFISNPREQDHHLNMRKCETVLAITPALDNRCSLEPEDCSAVNRLEAKSKCSSDQHFWNHSRTSFSNQFKKQEEIVSRKLKYQNTAPGQLCDMETFRESMQKYSGLLPVNRFRSTSSNIQCSRYTSVVSVATSRMTSKASSQMSLLLDKRQSRLSNQEDPQCKICLCDCSPAEMVTIEECRCSFCNECLREYITFEIMAGSYDISCPDPECPAQGVLSHPQKESLTDKELLDKHKSFRLNTEVSLDTARIWCPTPGCNTICHICNGSKYQGVSVNCPTCVNQFCSLCSATWHEGLDCQDGEDSGTSPWDALQESIKRCPVCGVPIEKDEGCAQMMCKRCKHVFCWYCLASLDGDFLLRHYDSGSCRGKLGHTRSSVVFHRAQVIGIFSAFGILLLLASPLIIVAAPAIICCKCRSCRKSVELKKEASKLAQGRD